MTRAPATAKLNLALVVGRPSNGKHELTTVYQRLDLADRIAVAPAPRLRVTGFAEDTLVGGALGRLAETAGGAPPRGAGRRARTPCRDGGRRTALGGAADQANPFSGRARWRQLGCGHGPRPRERDPR